MCFRQNQKLHSRNTRTQFVILQQEISRPSLLIRPSVSIPRLQMPFLNVPVAEASLVQNKILSIVPKISSFLSLCSSIYIVFDVLNMYRLRRNQVKAYHRILLGMSTVDILASTAWFFTTWPIPPDVFPAFGASGTQATCTAQGFFTQLSVSAVFYNGCLALYYCLVIRFGYSDRKISEAKIELVMHVVALSFGIGTSTAGTIMGLMNPIGWDCWLSAVPLGCKESWLHHGETTCIRGDNANLFQWVFFYLPLWIIIFLVSIAMYMISRAYKVQVETASKYGEKATERAVQIETTSVGNDREQPLRESIRRSSVKSAPGRSPASGRTSRSQLVTSQALLYSGSFYFVWFFPTILRVHEVTSDVVYYHWVLLSATFVPLQGTFIFERDGLCRIVWELIFLLLVGVSRGRRAVLGRNPGCIFLEGISLALN